MNPVERAIRVADRYQQRHGWAGFPFGVIKKFGDDAAGVLAALLAWNAFFALFPLLLLLFTVLNFVVGNNPELQRRVVNSALAEFPVVGTQLQGIGALHASGLALLVGLAGTIWGSRGVTQAGQYAMAEVWNIPGKERPSFVTRQLRGLLLLALFAAGLVATTLLTALGSLGTQLFGTRLAFTVAAAILNIVLFLLAYRVLTPRQIQTRSLVPGSVLGGILWEILLTLGGYLVAHGLRHASEVYGTFGAVLGLMSWIFLGSEITLYCAEINVVRAKRLWPRSILQPPLTESDVRALHDLAKQEERRTEQTVDVSFADSPTEPRQPS